MRWSLPQRKSGRPNLPACGFQHPRRRSGRSPGLLVVLHPEDAARQHFLGRVPDLRAIGSDDVNKPSDGRLRQMFKERELHNYARHNDGEVG